MWQNTRPRVQVSARSNLRSRRKQYRLGDTVKKHIQWALCLQRKLIAAVPILHGPKIDSNFRPAWQKLWCMPGKVQTWLQFADKNNLFRRGEKNLTAPRPHSLPKPVSTWEGAWAGTGTERVKLEERLLWHGAATLVRTTFVLTSFGRTAAFGHHLKIYWWNNWIEKKNNVS
jgi:hypothetical protein